MVNYLSMQAPSSRQAFRTRSDVEDIEMGRNLARYGIFPEDTRDHEGSDFIILFLFSFFLKILFSLLFLVNF
jgi:hypothetical protein